MVPIFDYCDEQITKMKKYVNYINVVIDNNIKHFLNAKKSKDSMQ